MNQPNKFAPPKASLEVTIAARPKAPGSHVLAGLILVQSLAMLSSAKLLFEMVRTGESNVASGLCVTLAWALLLAGGVRLVIGTRRPRYIFAGSAVFGFSHFGKCQYSSSPPER